MTITNEAIFEAAAGLPLDAREALATALDSADVVQQREIAQRLRCDIDEERRRIEQSWAVEAQRRIAAAKRGEMKAIPADQLMEELRAKE